MGKNKCNKLAINGGPEAAGNLNPRTRHKVGTAEFVDLARRFGYSPAAVSAVRKAVGAKNAGGGAFMGRYGGDPAATQGPRLEALARTLSPVTNAFYALLSGSTAERLGPELSPRALGLYNLPGRQAMTEVYALTPDAQGSQKC